MHRNQRRAARDAKRSNSPFPLSEADRALAEGFAGAQPFQADPAGGQGAAYNVSDVADNDRFQQLRRQGMETGR